MEVLWFCESIHEDQLSSRLWNWHLQRADLFLKDWANSSNKAIEELANSLTRSVLPMTGKSTFKEEFVTAGGVDLKHVNFQTMEHKLVPNLYFAGEVLKMQSSGLTG